MFNLPSWISQSKGGGRLNEAATSSMSDPAISPLTAVAAPTASEDALLKRKRDSDGDAVGEEPNESPGKRQRLDDAVVGRQAAVDSRTIDTAKSISTTEGIKHQPVVAKRAFSASELARARQAIETQFSLETLLKHNELRLIEQELAKCQVVLEQLRRCHLIPYPVFDESPDAMLNVMQGTGPAVAPKWAPPYGVVDGPYTRHYASGLKPDLRFDGVPYVDAAARTSVVPEGRSTRNSSIVESSAVAKSRSSRGSTGTRSQLHSNGKPQPKAKNGPASTTRHSDGRIVKLVCLDCQRENFSSVQGFINHCRIGHHRDFKTHEEAAIACGQVIEGIQTASNVSEQSSSVPAPAGAVHQLIRDTPPDRDAYTALLSRIDDSVAMFEQGKLPGITSIPSLSARTVPSNNSNFVPAGETPHLSRLLHSRGFAGNLGAILTDAKTRINLDDVTPTEEADEAEEDETTINNTPIRPCGGLDGAGDSPSPYRASARPAQSLLVNTNSNAPISMGERVPVLPPTYGAAAVVLDHDRFSLTFDQRMHHGNASSGDDVEIHGLSAMDLSPHTVSSNNAPSLVSDDDEDDGSDDDASKSVVMEDDSDVAEIDIEDGEPEVEKMVPRSALHGKAGKEDKHVTFVSPIKN